MNAPCAELAQHVKTRASARRAPEDDEFNLAGAAYRAQLRRVAGATDLIAVQFQLVGKREVHMLLAIEKQHNRVIIHGSASARGIGRVHGQGVTLYRRGAHLASFGAPKKAASEQTT
jgi:hypothetical protein